jgi:hypothetical protein
MVAPLLRLDWQLTAIKPRSERLDNREISSGLTEISSDSSLRCECGDVLRLLIGELPTAGMCAHNVLGASTMRESCGYVAR